MRIACITDDGFTISQHFGRAPYYAVLTVEEGKIIARELRSKTGHREFSQSPAEPTGERHGMDAASHDKHLSMASPIQDCDVLLCRGMGYGAYQSMLQMGIKPIVTDEVNVEAAVLAYTAGTLEEHPELLH